MTAPVITGPQKISMTVPVTTNREYMQFVLPVEFSSVDQIPKPNDNSIAIHSIPQRIVAVSTFHGAYSNVFFEQKLNELHRNLLRDELLASVDGGRVVDNENIKWSYAQYNPPFTIPYFRRNEVWIEIPNDQCMPALKTLVESEQSQ